MFFFKFLTGNVRCRCEQFVEMPIRCMGVGCFSPSEQAKLLRMDVNFGSQHCFGLLQNDAHFEISSLAHTCSRARRDHAFSNSFWLVKLVFFLSNNLIFKHPFFSEKY